jgi:4-amino-4-deoxy-L-arabinose transferase-like glycosyltransferase
LALAFFLVLWLPSLSPHYGFYSDELYYLACADRPALGYVDQPPLFVWLLRLHRAVFGDSQLALRALPAAAGALTAFLAGWMARRMGGGPFAQLLATLAVMVSGVSLIMFSFFTVNATAILLWTVASWTLLELCRSRNPRLWLSLGAVLGLALLNKHTAVVPVAGVAVATLFTPLRRDLATRWPWLGALAGVAILAPNLYWQLAHDWVSFAFYSKVEAGRLTASAWQQIELQVMAQNPVSLPIWAGGLWFFLASPRGLRFRALGWLFATGLLLAILAGSMLPYRIAGVFPAAFAGGAVLLESIRRTDVGIVRRIWNTWTLPALMLLVGAAIATYQLPILPPEQLARHPLNDDVERLSFRTEIGRNEIPYHLGNRTHWKAFVAEIEAVVAGLSPEQRRNAIILADYFGHAGALEHYAPERLPPVYSPMTGYLLWGPPKGSPQTVISIGIDEQYVGANFERPEVVATFRCRFCPPVVSELPIYVTGPPKRPFAELWPEIGALDRRRTRMLRAQQAEAQRSAETDDQGTP